MNLTQLEYFTKIAEELSYSRAAQKLFISQSALSKSMRALENELNCKLFVKKGKNLFLSKNGEILLKFSREIIQFYQKKTDEIKLHLGLSNAKLSVGIPPTAGGIFFYRVVHRFKQQYPETELEIKDGTSKDVIDRILKMDEDMGIVVEPCVHPDIKKFPVVKSEYVLLVSKHHRLSGRESVKLSELENEPLALLDHSFLLYDYIRSRFEEVAVTMNEVFQNMHWEWIYSIVENNMAVTILPYPLIEKFANANISIIHIEEPLFPYTLSLVYNKNAIQSEAMKTFLQIAKEESDLI